MKIISVLQFTEQEIEDLIFSLKFTLSHCQNEKSVTDEKITDEKKINLNDLLFSLEKFINTHSSKSKKRMDQIKKTFKERISSLRFNT